jgi:hypothetical protein
MAGKEGLFRLLKSEIFNLQVHVESEPEIQATVYSIMHLLLIGRPIHNFFQKGLICK